MRTSLTFFLTALLSAAVVISQDPMAAGQTLDADTVVLQAIAAFSPVPLNSIQLAGSARAIAGTTDESGTFIFGLKNSGESSLHLEVGVFSRTDKTGAFGESPACTWIGSDGAEREAADHNCWLS